MVAQGSRVTVELVGRLLNLNGVKFFSTKEKTDEFGEGKPLTFTIGRWHGVCCLLVFRHTCFHLDARSHRTCGSQAQGRRCPAWNKAC